MSSSVQPIGAEKTTTGPNPSLAWSSFMRFRIFGIPLPSTSRRLPPNFATESFFLKSVTSRSQSLADGERSSLEQNHCGSGYQRETYYQEQCSPKRKPHAHSSCYTR